MYFSEKAFLVIPLLFTFSGSASACMELPTYKESIGRADLVFEGHLIDYEERDGFHAILTFKVDKNWKGTKQGQLIKLTKPAMFSFREANILAEYDKKPNRVVFLDSKIDASGPDILYRGGACPDGVINSPVDEKKAQEMLRHTWQFWPAWAFHSFKRWIASIA